MTLIELTRKAGVVGAGGGGFPAHVKFPGRAEIVIGNGAECEPLLHKDAAVIEHRARDIVRGMELVMDQVGATEGVLGIKEKKKAVVAAAREACAGSRVRVHLLGDYYPAGDEYDLVFEVTGRLIPPHPPARRPRTVGRGSSRRHAVHPAPPGPCPGRPRRDPLVYSARPLDERRPRVRSWRPPRSRVGPDGVALV